jgi:hypothetical protein
MNDLVEDPRGKYFAAESFVGREQIQFPLLHAVTGLQQQDGKARIFSKDELLQRAPLVFILFQARGQYAHTRMQTVH